MLKIESAGHTIHIQQFSGDMQSRAAAAFHPGQIDLAKINPSGCDEFLSEGTATLHRVTAAMQLLEQTLLQAARKI